MKHYNVTGMSCAACVAHVEKAVKALDGVDSCSVSLLTNSMCVEGSVNPDTVIKAVQKAGFSASLKDPNVKNINSKDSDDALLDLETPKLKKRLFLSLILLLPLMYVSMGHMLFDWPLPIFLDGNHVSMGVYELVLSLLIAIVNKKFFISGFKSCLNKAPNMDTLVALGSGASFIYSIYALIAMVQAKLLDNQDLVLYYMHEFYFESAAMILTLITVGKLLEAKAKGRTTDALKSLMKLSAKSATILENGVERTVAIEDVKVSDTFLVKPGESIAVDGVVVDGQSAVNEATLTGESIPVEKHIGDKVYASTINTNGYLVCKAQKVGVDTTLSKIIELVSNAAATKAPIAKIADKVSGFFVPVVIVIALITFIIWLFAGESFGYALTRAVSVLVISCPCALGLATPVAIMVGNAKAAKSSILFKTASSLEIAGKTNIVALDKTGTVSSGVMSVTDLVSINNKDSKELIKLAYAIENKSEHPISKAIVAFAKKNNIELTDITDFKVVPGNGLKAKVNGEIIRAGSAKFIASETLLDEDELNLKAENFTKDGKSIVFITKDNNLIGLIAIADTIKEDSAKAIAQLKALGLKVVMLTGDNKVSANAIAKKVGISDVISEVKPEGKLLAVDDLKKYGKVCMVGDGINDAPALTKADLGVAIGAGTDIAIDAADIVLTKSSLLDVAAAIRISRATVKNIKENLFWAFIYNLIGIPLAAGCFVHAFNLTLNPMIGAAAMSLSSFCVISNALRLNLIKPYDDSKDKEISNIDALNIDTSVYSNLTKSEIKMDGYNMIIKVNGMMCPRCEAHVKKALEAIDGIESAVASHEKNCVSLTTSKDLDESVIKAAIENEGYEYLGFEK